MSDAQHEDILTQLKEPEMAERLRRKRRFAETMAETTGLQKEWRQKGQKKTLIHLLEKRFTRSLTQEENAQLAEKMLRLGADRILNVVLELGKEALVSWLSDPQSL